MRKRFKHEAKGGQGGTLPWSGKKCGSLPGRYYKAHGKLLALHTLDTACLQSADRESQSTLVFASLKKAKADCLCLALRGFHYASQSQRKSVSFQSMGTIKSQVSLVHIWTISFTYTGEGASGGGNTAGGGLGAGGATKSVAVVVEPSGLT